MKSSIKEKKDLFFAGIMISLAFAILLSGGLGGIFSSKFFIIFIIAFFTAGTGFLFHELMHKYVAQSYGLFAEFRAYYKMLFMAIAFSFFGFILAAPGAVYIRGNINEEKNGKISLAGPLTNLVLGFLFLIFLLVIDSEGILRLFLSFGLIINSLLAAFNMIPVMPFDGSKILAWNKKVYVITLISAISLFFLSRII